MKRILAVGIILLFIGVAVAPSINHEVVTASTESNLLKITTQVCGLTDFEDRTVTLPQGQYQELLSYLTDFSTRLNTTKNTEDTEILFKEALQTLDSYGLLPQGMTVSQAVRFMTRGLQLQQVLSTMNQGIQRVSNFFCLFAAMIYDSVDYNLWVMLGALVSLLFDVETPLVVLVYLFFFIGFYKPLRFNNIIVVLGHVIAFFSLGLSGITVGGDSIESVIGFTGLKIMIDFHRSFYLGFALLV